MKLKLFKRCITPIVYLLLCASTGTALAGKLYKWIDENGRVRYGDSIPPQYARKSNETLNDQGIVVEQKAAAKTPAQIAAEERRKKAEAEAEQVRKEQAYQDRILLDTFTNEDEMIMTRDGKIEAIEAIIRVTNGRSAKLKQRLADLRRKAANMERAGRPVPKQLNAEIADTREQIAKNQRYVQSRGVEQENIRQKFEAGIRRFRELKAAQADAAETHNP